MSGTLPTTVAPKRVEISSTTATDVSLAHSLKRQARSRNAHRWGIKFIYAPLSRVQWAELYSFLVKQRGRYETFDVVLPLPLVAPQGSHPGAPAVNNDWASPTILQTGSRTVHTKLWTPSQSKVLKAGDFIQYAGHTKVYMATLDIDSDGSGFATITQEPALIEGPANGAAITVANFPFRVSLVSDLLDGAIDVNPIFDLQIEMMEAY